MNSNFFYQPKETMIRVNSPNHHGLDRKNMLFPIANHQSPPVLKVMHPSIQENMHSEYFNRPISKQIPILPQKVLAKHQQQEDNKLNRSNSEAIYSNTSPSAFAEAARSKGFSESNPKMAWPQNHTSTDFFDYPPPPRQIQKIEPIRRISQHKSTSSDFAKKSDDFNHQKRENDMAEAHLKSSARQQYYTIDNKQLGSSYTKMLKNSRQLIDEIFENQTHKALLQINSIRPRSNSRKARSISQSKRI